MNIVILTTVTTHHVYIVQELSKYFPIKHVMLETRTIKPPFNIAHDYLALQDSYETDLFFNGNCPDLDSIVETSSFYNLNSKEAINKLIELNPDIIINAGSGKLHKEFIEVCPERIVNLHGGDPQKYRGLDSLLWSIYHDDFDSIMVTLHILRSELDTGEIVQQARINLFKGMKLHQLRAQNVITCVMLLVNAINSLKNFNQLLTHPQIALGSYYSFMPSELKEICRIKFEKYTQGL
jgi:methionyl-tRNA formyltransferase